MFVRLSYLLRGRGIYCPTQPIDLRKKFIFIYFPLVKENVSISVELMVHPWEICLCQWNILSLGSLIKECHFPVFCTSGWPLLSLDFSYRVSPVPRRWTQWWLVLLNYQWPRECGLMENVRNKRRWPTSLWGTQQMMRSTTHTKGSRGTSPWHTDRLCENKRHGYFLPLVVSKVFLSGA